jgi:uncharacterized repeat protein (TIGR01451 family)
MISLRESGMDGRRRGWTAVLLLALALLALPARPAHADYCSDYGGLLDGYAGTPAPSQLYIDMNCTIRNYPASNPFNTNISFSTKPGQTNQRWLVVFDNVVHTGQMACNSVAGHKIWFTNGSSTSIQEGCQNLLIPVEKIDKASPGPTATIGVPFTYTLTMPVLFDPGTTTVINTEGSVNDLHSVTMTDDLNALGVDLTFVSEKAYWKDTGAPVAHTFTNVGNVLTFDNFPIIPAGQQIIVEITVVLQDTPTNAPGTQFTNVAKWEFGRLIDGVFYQPLPGEWGIAPPMTIAAPQLVVTKTGPATLGRTLNLGEWGQFNVDVQNTGLTDAWNATILDRLPDGPTGGMCNMTPQILTAQVFAADGVSTVPGKGPLTAGTDYTLSYSSAPTCELTLTMLTPQSAIGPGEHLIVSYRTQLDSDTQQGAMLTNVAGAVQWFNGDSNNPDRVGYSRTLTDGTVGVVDFQDAHTVTAALSGYFFEKTVVDLTSGADPATTAAPGDTLRYTLRLQATDLPLSNFTFHDDMGAMNATAVFQPGSLSLVTGTVPAGADTSNTNPNGGTNSAGILDVRGLNVPANSEIQIQFDIKLASRIPNGTVVTNQAGLTSGGATVAVSDDPYVNGQADPNVAGDEDPTRVQIVSAPQFQVQKVSADVSGDPNLLLAGETLRYTITVKNIGTDDATDATLRDQIPANTTYVAGSTTLNGAAVADGPGGQSPLSGGLPIDAPENPTPGAMRADASATQSNVATIVFSVIVDPNAVDGTVISNQGFVSAVASGIPDQPSDDPRTPVANDPTRDIVGSLPLLFAEKSVVIQVDGGSPNIVDPGDVLRYTVAIHNNSSIDATGAILRDAVPANTTYVADSTTLNGLPVGQPDGGAAPLAAGIPVSSSDLTPPLPGAGGGTITARQTAIVQYDLLVNPGTPRGTLISNQGRVETSNLPPLLTDGDGNPATGPEPTVVVVGDAQQLSIVKQVSVVGGGPAVAGATLEYVVRVMNIATVPALYTVITDDLDMPIPGYLHYVDQSATMNGSTTGVSVAGSVITADYSAAYGNLAPNNTVELRFRAVIDSNLPIGTTITNTGVVTWNRTQTASASVSIDVGGVPGVGILSGTVWHDANFDKLLDPNERVLEGWTVNLYRDGRLAYTTLTGADGTYRISGVEPNYGTTTKYELRFAAPGAGPNTAALGKAYSQAFTNGLQTISDIIVAAGSNLLNLNLPIDPNGVVYNSVTRAPIAGATLSLEDESGQPLPSACLDDPAQQGQVTLADGYYKFDINFSDPSCPSGAGYLIGVTPPTAAYIAGHSDIIPPSSDETTAPFSVPTCPGSVDDAIAATPTHCEAQTSEFAPPLAVAPASPGTKYYLHLLLDSSDPPGSSQIFNNHIALDPDLSGVVSITKTTPLLNVSRGQLVPYTITIASTYGATLTGLSIVDRFPAGFKYVEGSGRIDGVPAEPTITGLEAAWSGVEIEPSGRHTLQLLLAVGAGVTEGEYVNRAQVISTLTGNPVSGEASATVRLVPDPTFDCTDVVGKVFADQNRNGVQDGEEPGIGGVRLATTNGLIATTDPYGRFHITCAITPREGRGSNFVLKLDDRTLPTGYRLSTAPLQIKRATRGKALRFDFGASIYRVIGLDLADAVFEPGTAEIRNQWKPRLDLLLTELKKAPAVLHLSYAADLEDPKLVEQRVATVKHQIETAWTELDCCYRLVIEPEVFWRLGKPPDRPRSSRSATGGDRHD